MNSPPARIAPIASLLAFLACAPALPLRGPANPILIHDRFPAPPPSAAGEDAWTGPVIALVIDDAGESMEQIAPLLPLPLDLSFAILPDAAQAPAVARTLVRAGREVLAHLPMEPEDPIPTVYGEHFLTVSMSEAEIQQTLSRQLARVPGATGANNHTGSLFTADEARMRTVLIELKRRGLFFLDSRTTPRTTGRTVATGLGLPLAERTVFLDNVPDEACVLARLQELVATAKARGCAVGIGHARPETIRALLRFTDAGLDPGVRAIRVGRLAGRPCGAAAP